MPSVISFDVGLRREGLGEADFEADVTAKRRGQLGRRMRAATLRAAMRRGCVWPIQAIDAAAQFEADLGQLGRLARARLAANDDDLVVADGQRDVVAFWRRLAARRHSESGARLDGARSRMRPSGGPLRPAVSSRAIGRCSILPWLLQVRATGGESGDDRRAWHGRSHFRAGTEWTLGAAADRTPPVGARKKSIFLYYSGNGAGQPPNVTVHGPRGTVEVVGKTSSMMQNLLRYPPPSP